MRCIVHVDMDCFYAQVECARLGLDCRTTPFVLVQWGSLIAVNYPARAAGIRRFFDSFSAAQGKCPELQYSYSPTYRVGETTTQYHPNPQKQTHKVSLEPYREASRKIFHILRHSEPGIEIEKGSIDEAYLDVTAAAEMELARVREAHAATAGAAPLSALDDVLDPETRLIADRTEEMEAFFASRGTTLERVYDEPMRALKRGEMWPEGVGSRHYWVRRGCSDAERAEAEANSLLLCAASRVVARLRARIYAELRYDCSAGIAHNRLLAKCISAAHKPRQQTLLLPDRSASALFDLPLDKVRGFGGKLGDAVREICGGGGDGAIRCRDAWLAPTASFASLDESYDDVDDGAGDDGAAQGAVAERTAGSGIYFRLRGFSGDTVADPALPTAVEAGKIFHPASHSLRAALRWLVPIAADLADRYSDYAAALSPRGRLLTVRLIPYPRRAVLKSRPRMLPDTEPALLVRTLVDTAEGALRELLASLGLTVPDEESESEGQAGEAPSASTSPRDPGTATMTNADTALPLHRIALTVSCLRPLQGDPLRGTPTLRTLFSASSARRTLPTTTETFFAAPRAKRPRADEVEDVDDDEDVVVARTEVTATAPAKAHPPNSLSVGVRGEKANTPRLSTLDAFCRPTPRGGLPAAEHATVLLPHSPESVQTSPSSSVEALSPMRGSSKTLAETVEDVEAQPAGVEDSTVVIDSD